MDGGSSMNGDGGRPNEVSGAHERRSYQQRTRKGPKEQNHDDNVQVPTGRCDMLIWMCWKDWEKLNTNEATKAL